MSEHPRAILVSLDLNDAKGPTPCGALYAERRRGQETFSFEYDANWLKKQGIPIDPQLPLTPGRHFLANREHANFGAFLDASPDRWGRLLMRRREALRARTEERQARTLSESDFLLGVHDGHRIGALRFRLEPDGSFLDDDPTMGPVSCDPPRPGSASRHSPPWAPSQYRT
jgi:serine/threonine-protein kinase HipA